MKDTKPVWAWVWISPDYLPVPNSGGDLIRVIAVRAFIAQSSNELDRLAQELNKSVKAEGCTICVAIDPDGHPYEVGDGYFLANAIFTYA